MNLDSKSLLNFQCYKTSGSGPGPGGGRSLDFEFVPIGTYNDCSEAEDELGYGWDCSKHQKDIYVEIPSDGLVTAESAKELPNRQRDVKMDGSNHFQMRNDMQTEEKLKALFKGEYSPMNYFELDEQ